MRLLPWLYSAFGTLFGSVATYFAKRSTFAYAAIAAIFAISAAFKSGVDLAISTLQSVTPTGAFLFGLGLLPSNVSTCLTAYVSAHLAAIAYRHYKNILELHFVTLS